MKLVAHSLVPPAPVPYLHLGYTAAAMAHANRTENSFPGLQVILPLCFTFTMLGLVLVGFVRRRFPRLGQVFLGVSILAFVTGIVCMSIRMPHRYTNPHAATRYHLLMLESNLAYRLEVGEPAPGSIQYLNAKGEIFGAYQERRSLAGDLPGELQLYHYWENSKPYISVYEDGWKHSLQLERRQQKGINEYTLVSAGPDGRFGTTDDIRGTTLTDRSITETRMRYLMKLINQSACRTATPVPTDMAAIRKSQALFYADPTGFRKIWKLLPTDTCDAWGHAFRIVRPPKALYAEALTSAGPDGRWGTADDITVKRQPDKIYDEAAGWETNENADYLAKQLERGAFRSDIQPAQLRKLCQQQGLALKYSIDGWGHPYGFTVTGKETERNVYLLSAGPDRQFDTEDDFQKVLYLSE
ncbi:MAG: hypothetical protein ACYDCO_24785 [Armatimonadota bacterium]